MRRWVVVDTRECEVQSQASLVFKVEGEPEDARFLDLPPGTCLTACAYEQGFCDFVVEGLGGEQTAGGWTAALRDPWTEVVYDGIAVSTNDGGVNPIDCGEVCDGGAPFLAVDRWDMGDEWYFALDPIPRSCDTDHAMLPFARDHT